MITYLVTDKVGLSDIWLLNLGKVMAIVDGMCQSSRNNVYLSPFPDKIEDCRISDIKSKTCISI